jgi:nitroreductase
MDVLAAIRTRRSIRKYQKDPVPEAELEEILDAGRWAPSGSNLQPCTFIVLNDPKVREEVAGLLPLGKFLNEAPLGIAVVSDRRLSSTAVQDGSIAAYSMLLAAHSLGLGACWLAPSVNEDILKVLLGIPGEARLICVISLGYPDESGSTTRKELNKMVSINRYVST